MVSLSSCSATKTKNHPGLGDLFHWLTPLCEQHTTKDCVEGRRPKVAEMQSNVETLARLARAWGRGAGGGQIIAGQCSGEDNNEGMRLLGEKLLRHKGTLGIGVASEVWKPKPRPLLMPCSAHMSGPVTSPFLLSQPPVGVSTNRVSAHSVLLRQG